jgi:hypothetical protein
MKQSHVLLRFCAVVLLLSTGAASAQESTTTFSGFVDLNFAWNPNTPANHQNFIPGTGTTAKRANEFALNLAQVQWTRGVSPEQPVGFTLSLVAGEGTEVVHAGEPEGVGKFRNIYQASLAYRLANGVVVEGGIYPSHVGMEGFYSKDNWNYTRSWLGEFSPYYQTGVKVSYPFNERWSGQIHLLNGWQIINDNNDEKAVGTQIAYSNGGLSASLNTFFGDEGRMRKFADVVATYRVTPQLQIGGSIDAGDQENASWAGAGAYARFAPNDRQAFAIRAEHFRDPDNGITGAAQTLREATLTYEHRPRPNLILKLEGRYDESTADVFFDGDTTTDSQFLVMAGVVVTF